MTTDPSIAALSGVWVTEAIAPGEFKSHKLDAILELRQTPYQQLLIGESTTYGKSLVLNGEWQSSVVDEFLYHEPLVHPAMLHQGAPERILILGGGEGATLREVLRWHGAREVVMVDIDEEVVDACKRHLPEMHQGAFEDPRGSLVIGDAYEYVQAAPAGWDVIISDVTDPSDPSVGGPAALLYSREFFLTIASKLAPGATFVTQAGHVEITDLEHYSAILEALEDVFPYVHPYLSYVPTFGSTWGYALCSGEPLGDRMDAPSLDIAIAEKIHGELRMLDGKSLGALLDTPYYLRRARLRSQRPEHTLPDDSSDRRYVPGSRPNEDGAPQSHR